LGIVRLALALIVVAAHAQSYLPGLGFMNAFQAVNVFFIVSGFYMALILNERYVRPGDTRRFYVNRAVRLFPVYWFGLVLALCAQMATTGQALKPQIDALTPLGWIFAIVSNLLIVGQELPYTFCLPVTEAAPCLDPVAASLNPPAWSIAVEIAFYALAPFLVRDPRRIAGMILVGVAYFWAVRWVPASSLPDGVFAPRADAVWVRYYTLPSSFVFFGIGAFAYHMGRSSPIQGENYGLCVLVAVAVLTIDPIMPGWSILLTAIAVPALFHLTKHVSFDRKIGDLSYPVYILHFPVLVVARHHFAGSPDAIFYATIVGTLIASVLIKLAIEDNVERLRALIRPA